MGSVSLPSRIPTALKRYKHTVGRRENRAQGSNSSALSPESADAEPERVEKLGSRAEARRWGRPEGSEGEQPAEPQSNVDVAETLALLPIRNRLLTDAQPLRELFLAQAHS